MCQYGPLICLNQTKSDEKYKGVALCISFTCQTVLSFGLTLEICFSHQVNISLYLKGDEVFSCSFSLFLFELS